MPTPNTEYCHKSTRAEIPKFKLTCYPDRKRRRGLSDCRWLAVQRWHRHGLQDHNGQPTIRPPQVAAALPALQFLMKCIDPAQLAHAPALVKSAITGEERVLSAVSESAQPLP
jgi:hypothetical protein